MDKNNNIKISDFGISAIYNDNNDENCDKDSDLFSQGTRVGRRDFVCPEIEFSEEYDYVCDTFSLGLAMLCLMSFRHPITVSNKIRTIDFNTIINTYNFFLRKLVFKLLYKDNNKNKKLSANDAYNELEIIEIYINNPNNIIAINCLTEINKNISENSKNEMNLNTVNNENNLNYQIFPYINLLFNQNFYLQNYINQLQQNTTNFYQIPFYQNQAELNLNQNSYSENIQNPYSQNYLQQNNFQRSYSQNIQNSYSQNQFQQKLNQNNINDNQSQNEKQIIEFEIADRRKTKIKIEANKNMTLEDLSNIFYSKYIEELKLIDKNEYRLNGKIPLNIKSKKTLSELIIENNSIITVKPTEKDMIIEFEISPEKIFKIEANKYMTLENLIEAFKLKFIKENKLIDEEGYRLNGNIPLAPNSIKTLSELKIENGSKIKVKLQEKNNLIIKFILVKNDGKKKEIEFIANEEMIFGELISLLMNETGEDFGKIEQCLLNNNIPINHKSKKTLSFLKVENKSEIKIMFN